MIYKFKVCKVDSASDSHHHLWVQDLWFMKNNKIVGGLGCRILATNPRSSNDCIERNVGSSGFHFDIFDHFDSGHKQSWPNIPVVLVAKTWKTTGIRSRHCSRKTRLRGPIAHQIRQTPGAALTSQCMKPGRRKTCQWTVCGQEPWGLQQCSWPGGPARSASTCIGYEWGRHAMIHTHELHLTYLTSIQSWIHKNQTALSAQNNWQYNDNNHSTLAPQVFTLLLHLSLLIFLDGGRRWET